MDDEEVLAAILVAASAFLLLLAVITLCVIVSCTGRNNNKQKSSEIPVSNLRHHSTNMAFENDQDHKTEETQIDSHKADWPTNYSRYAVSRSYAFPQRAGETSNPSSSSTNHQHKTFSEEVFASVNTKSHSTGGNHNHTKEAHGSNTATNHMNGGSNGVWKHRAGSTTESTGHQSLDRHSITTTSTESHTRDYSHSPEHEKPSYYSTFKTHKLYVSPAGHQETKQTTSQSTTSQQEKINSTHNAHHHQRERLNNNTGSSSDNVKIFKFNIS